MDSKINLKNGYVLIEDVKEERTSSGIYIPDSNYNRFSRIVAVSDETTQVTGLNVGDIIIKPLGRTTPITLNINGVDRTYDCLNSSFIFAKVVNDGE